VDQLEQVSTMSAGADEPPAAPSLRERGNSAFKNRDFETAEALYSAAIDETSSDADGDAASLLSNRAAARRARYGTQPFDLPERA